MRRGFAAALAGLTLVAAAGCVIMQSPPGAAPEPDLGIVRVASPTGEREADRASILAALEQVEPRGTVQFAAGTYLIGGMIRVPADDITLLGHPDGTVVRGCEPGDFPELPAALFACHGFELTGARQTVRNLTFEYTWHGLFVGCCFPANREELELREVVPTRSQPGGHLIEGNTFRYTPNGIRVIGESAERTVVRDNRFIDVYHAVQINGGAVHVLENDIAVRNPERVPTTNYPGDVINILPFSSLLDLLQSPTEDHTSCSGNVIARNRIDGYPDGIRILILDPRTSCRRNTIRDNTIIVRRTRWSEPRDGPRITDETDSTIVGVPLRLSNWARAGAAEGEDASDALIEDNLIEGNRVIGAEGVGIEILHASGNRILNNTITGIQRRVPFPGNTLGGEPERWRGADGSGIWLSPGSDGNEIAGNRFEDVATYSIVLEGDSNRVEIRSPSDEVRDLGTGNRVSTADGATAMLDSEEQAKAMHESRFVVAGGVRLHYLDFGGAGLPIIFVHSPAWDAHTWEAFAPRFADRNRVLAVTRRGYGKSGGHGGGYDVPTQAESLVAFLDAMGIERAVFAGNSGPTAELTYLAEHHPDRVAGLIYLAGLAPLWLDDVRRSDPSGAEEMAFRAIYSDPADRERLRLLWAYRPEFLKGDRPPIAVPALAFVARSGTRGTERWVSALSLVGSPLLGELYRDMPPSPWRDHLQRLVADEAYRLRELEQIADPAARAYLLRLAGDEALQAAVYRHHQEVIRPVLVAGQEEFRRAFGDDLRLVRLDVPEVEGYEYRDAPELIEAHVRRFLEEVSQTAKVREGPTPAKGSGSGVQFPDRRFMAGYAADLLSHDPDAIAARYSRRGAYLVLPGSRKLAPHDSILSDYRAASWHGPDTFEWQDLSYEVLNDDMVAVVGSFRWESVEGGVLGSYTALLVREDGELRIRLENESFDDLPPPECAARERPCDLPLERAALERYTGEYQVPGQEDFARIRAEDATLMFQPPGLPPMRLLYRGGDEFRLAEDPAVRVVFDGAGERATSYIVLRGMVLGAGNRVTAPNGLDGRELAGRQSAVRDTILSLTNDLVESWSRLEPDDYLARFSGDLVFYIQGSRLSRRDFTNAVREIMASVRQSTFKVLDPEVVVLGPDAAVISFQWTETTMDSQGATAHQAGAITLVYERRGGEWLVIRAHESLRPAR